MRVTRDFAITEQHRGFRDNTAATRKDYNNG
jgi:hypothetical protein